MAPARPEPLDILVVYAPAGCVRQFSVALPAGACVRDAIAVSGVLREFPELSLGTLDLGVFNRPCTLEQRLHDGDRVEIYRPLQIDPKAARHLRVAARRKADARSRQGAREAAAAAVATRAVERLAAAAGSPPAADGGPKEAPGTD